MSFGKRAFSALGKLGIIIAVGAAFLFGLAGTIYLSLRTSEVKVPDIVGKDFLAAETTLSDAGLNVRKRGTRPTAEKPNVVLDQLPRAGEVVKVGQTVAVDVSRAPKEGEAAISGATEAKPEPTQKNENQNANESTAEKNQNNSNNQNKRPKNANNKNANTGNALNVNNRNAGNSNNANNRNANANRGPNTNGGGNANRSNTNLNTNRRAPTPTTPPANPGGNTRTP